MRRVGGLSSSEEADTEETAGMSAGDAAQADPAPDPAAAGGRGAEAPAEEAANTDAHPVAGGRRSKRGRGPRKSQLKDSAQCEICWGRHANNESAKAQHSQGHGYIYKYGGPKTPILKKINIFCNINLQH